MATSQVTRFSFPCIKIHQTSLIPDPRRRLPSTKFKKDRMTFFMNYANLHQQTISVHNTRN